MTLNFCSSGLPISPSTSFMLCWKSNPSLVCVGQSLYQLTSPVLSCSFFPTLPLSMQPPKFHCWQYLAWNSALFSEILLAGRGSVKACGCGHASKRKRDIHTRPRSLCLTRCAASRTRRKAAVAAKHYGSVSAHHRRKCRRRKRTARRSAPSAVRQRTKSSETAAQR